MWHAARVAPPEEVPNDQHLEKMMMACGVAGTIATGAAAPSLAQVWSSIEPRYGYGAPYGYVSPYHGYAYVPGYRLAEILGLSGRL